MALRGTESTSGSPTRRDPGTILRLETSLAPALDALRVDPARTRTALLCVASGAAVIVSLVSIVAGGRREMLRSVEAAGPSNVFLRPARPGGAVPTTAELERARARFEGLAGAAGVRSRPVAARVSGRETTVPVHGVGEGIERVFALRVAEGRGLGEADFRARRRVALAGASLSKGLAVEGPPVGRRLDAGGETWEVVGVLKPLPSDTSAGAGLPSIDWDRGLVVPLGAEPAASPAADESYPLDLAVLRFGSPSEAGRAARLLSALEEEAGRGIAVSTPRQALSQYRAARRSFDRVALLVSALTTLSAAFGVTNLLRASVRARSAEIGLRRAVGARQDDVRWQFLWEGFFLGAGGGLLGLLLGVLVSFTVLSRAGWSPHFAPLSTFLMTGGAALVGVAAGIQPAREAARLDPAAALRIE